MPSKLELAVRLVAALVLGGAIGFEGELTGQVAGLRMHMCVALGSALFAIVSAFGFEEFVRPRAETDLQVDATRVASNIVTGIGFPGGGAIIKEGASVRGLTTAASLWVTAAVGHHGGHGGTSSWPPSAPWPSGGADEAVVVLVQVRGRNVEVRLAELAERDDVVDVILAS